MDWVGIGSGGIGDLWVWGWGLGLYNNNKNPTTLLFIDALFQEYYDWTYASYPAPYHLGNGEVEDFSLKGIRKRIQQCVEFHNKVKDLQPANEKYTIYKAVFQVRNLPFLP